VATCPSCTIAPASQSICPGGSATFTVSATGGIPPYTFTWTGPGGFTATGATITVGVGGTYTATVTDSAGCQNTCTAQLIVNPNPICAITPATATTCVGGSQDYTVSITSGTGPFTVVLSGCINETITGVTGSVTRSHACTAPGTCTLTAIITDANGCKSTPCTATNICVPNPSCAITPTTA